MAGKQAPQVTTNIEIENGQKNLFNAWIGEKI